MEVYWFGLWQLWEESLTSLGVIEHVVDQDFTDDEAGDDHCDVFLSQFNFSFKQDLVLFYFGYFLWEFEPTIKTDYMGKLSLFKIYQELRRDG